ncbi:ThuA domain-containing protein [Aliiglaciecola sp. LCG003]|uniref:ThuA domain-containing protein n=1 Tax=Aliiglaciecola sp. LCG003 TaxID=3053655 RepID=UPI002573AB71|nr:ThuA domain-containing protein [Aliiglaciecola sp. LCG003]WJG08691.1 ThuA domain-containing protein [Aliiglaciecola sp. LCG003]
MKLLYLLPMLFLTACSSQAPKAILSEATATETFIDEPVTSTGRYFAYVPSPSILIFSETRDWRHEEGIAGANLAIMKAAKEMGHGYFTTEHSGIFNEKDLARFDVIVFNNMTGDALTPEQELAFAKWQSKGKGTVLLHGAGDDSHQDWSFYHNELLGATFVSHPMAPQFQPARVEILQPTHPVMAGMPKDFMAIDEWYTFDAPPSDDFIVLAGLDESTYSPVNTVYGDRSDLRMGPKPVDHPIIWSRCIGDMQARVVFNAMGHRYESYETEETLLLLKNMLNWAAKKTDPQSQGCAK